MSIKNHPIENIQKIINRGISRRIEETELYKDPNFSKITNSLISNDTPSQKVINLSEDLSSGSENEFLKKIKFPYFPEEDLVFLLNRIINGLLKNQIEKKSISLFLKQISKNDSILKNSEGFPELMGYILSICIKEKINIYSFYKYNDEKYIPLTLCFLPKENLTNFLKFITGLEKHNLSFHIPNIIDIFIQKDGLSEEHLIFLKGLIKTAVNSNEVRENILLTLYKKDEQVIYKKFKDITGGKVSLDYFNLKYMLSLEKNDSSTAAECLNNISWEKNKIYDLLLIYTAIKLNKTDILSTSLAEDSSVKSTLFYLGLSIQNPQNSKFKNTFNKMKETLLSVDKSIDNFEKAFIHFCDNYLKENKFNLDDFQKLLNSSKSNSKNSYHIHLILYLTFLIDSESDYKSILPLLIPKMNSSFDHPEIDSNIGKFMSYSKFQSYLIEEINQYYISEIYIPDSENQNLEKYDIVLLKTNINKNLDLVNKNYNLFITENLDRVIEVSNIHNDIKNYNYKYTQSLETASAAKKILFEDFNFFINSVNNVKSFKDKTKFIRNLFIHNLNNNQNIQNNKLEKFVIAQTLTLSEKNPEFGAKILGAMFLYSIVFEQEILYKASLKIIKKQKKFKTDENKNYFFPWEQEMMSSLSELNNHKKEQFKKLIDWVLNKSDEINLSSWFIAGFTRELYFYILGVENTERNTHINLVKKLELSISKYPNSIQHIKFYNFLSSIYNHFNDSVNALNYAERSIQTIRTTRLSSQWKDHLLNDTAIQFFRIKNNEKAVVIIDEVMTFSLNKKINTYLVETLEYIISKNIDSSLIEKYINSIKSYCETYFPTNSRLILALSKLLFIQNKLSDSISILSILHQDIQTEKFDKLLTFIYEKKDPPNPSELLLEMCRVGFEYTSFVKSVEFFINTNVNFNLEFIKCLTVCSKYQFESETLLLAFVLKRAVDLSIAEEYSNSLNHII